MTNVATTMCIAMKITHALHLSNSELVTEVGRLARTEREATVAFIVHLAEFDARRLYAGAGFSSTFRYCVEALHLSEDAAFNRIEAARAARAWPMVLDMLVTGALTPTTARMLRRHLTADNQPELLAAASGKSKQQVEALLVGRFPRPDVRPSVRALPMASVPTTRVSGVVEGAVSPVRDGDRHTGPCASEASGPNVAAPVGAPAATAEARPRPIMRPLSAERYQVRFTMTAETREKLCEAQDLLGHAVPSGDLAQVFDRALDVLITELRRRKLGATRRPRASRGQEGDSRHVPAQVRREVWERDTGRCAFVAASGRRCDERRRLEFHHHEVPYGVGGKPTVENIHLRCRAHNGYEAEQFYGPRRRYGGVDPKSQPGGSRTTAPTRPGTGPLTRRGSVPTASP